METADDSNKYGQQLGAVNETREEDEQIHTQEEFENAAKFDALIDSVLNNFSEVQISVQDLLQLKDDILLHYLPPPLLFRIAVVFGKVYRNFSDLNTPVCEMLRLVKIFSATWEKNSAVLKKLHDMYETKKNLLNIAIKRLALVDKKTKLFQREKRISNWEKLFIKMSESKGHGRRWKFQIEPFRIKAEQGYEELIRWIEKDQAGYNEDLNEERKMSKTSKNKAGKSKEGKEDDLDDNMDMKSTFSDENAPKDEKFVIEVDSDQDLFSDRSSDGENGRSKRKARGGREPLPLAKDMRDANVQTEPDVEDKFTWTGEPDYKRYFIVRLFKPAEFNSKKLVFTIKYAGVTFVSNKFETLKSEKKVKIAEPETKGKSLKKGKKKDSEPDAGNDLIDDKKLDVNRYEDFLFEISDIIKRKAGLEVSDDNCVFFELKSTDKTEKEPLIAYSNIQMEDIHTLDLPILYYKTNQEAQVIDFYQTNNASQNGESKSPETSSSWLRLNDLTIESVEKYNSMSSRQPITFDMFKTKAVKQVGNTPVCKLPAMFFWVRKTTTLVLDKNTGTQSIKDMVFGLTGFDIEKDNKEDYQQIPKSKELMDKASSPVNLLPTISPQRPPSTPIASLRSKHQSFDFTEAKNIAQSQAKAQSDRASSENKLNPSDLQQDMQAMQDNYQLHIDQLNLTIFQLENELAQQKALNELRSDPNQNRIIRAKPKMSIPKPEKLERPIKREPKPKPQAYEQPLPTYVPLYQRNPAVWSKEFPEDFFERLKLFSEKSSNHQRENFEKFFQEEAAIREQQMSVQHRLDIQHENTDKFEAVFMPYKSPSNVFNPRAHKYFHPTGSNDIRLTQPPSVFQLPPLPAKTSLSVINLFDLGQRYANGEPDFYINQYVNNTASKIKLSEEAKKTETHREKSIEIHLDNLDKIDPVAVNDNTQ